jgi:hypothetical protein
MPAEIEGYEGGFLTAIKFPCFSMPLRANTFIPPIVSKPIWKTQYWDFEL